MKIGILGEISRVGGGQYYMKDLINSLKNGNYLSLITDPSRDPLHIAELVDKVINVNYFYRDEDNYLKVLMNVLRLKKQLSNIKNNFDLLINNHPNIYLKKASINIFHGMSFLDPILDEYGNIQNKLILNMVKYSGLFKIYNNSNFIANSKYTETIANKTLPLLNINLKIKNILYPTFENQNKIADGNNILIFGRINIRKNIDKVIKIADKINRNVIIAGAVNEGNDMVYYQKLKNNAPDNVKFFINPDNDLKNQLFLKSKIYIHTNRKEHFGISVVEAMSYGLIPVVPKSGGPWMDIINEGEYGYGYSEYDEIPDLIEIASKQNNEYKNRIIGSTKRFSQENFRKRLNEIIDGCL